MPESRLRFATDSAFSDEPQDAKHSQPANQGSYAVVQTVSHVRSPFGLAAPYVCPFPGESWRGRRLHTQVRSVARERRSEARRQWLLNYKRGRHCASHCW